MPYRSVRVVPAAATRLAICRLSWAASVSMAMTRSSRRRQRTARTLGSSPINSSAARIRARVVRMGSGAGSRAQAAQFGVDAVDQGAAFGDQVLAVVEQGPQVRGGADGEPHRRQLRFTGGDPGDGQRVDRVGLALAELAAALP